MNVITDFLTSHTKLKCPHCQQERTNQDLIHLLQFDFTHRPPGKLRFIRCVKEGYADWACDHCIQTGKVLLANSEWQNVDRFTYPYFIYVDQNKQCENCRQPFVFSAREQQFWYEELKFIVWSQPTKCKTCRKVIRRQKLPHQILTQLIPTINLEDFLQMEQAITQYLQIGNIEKAKYYLAAAKKLSKSQKDKWLAERVRSLEEKIKATNQPKTD